MTEHGGNKSAVAELVGVSQPFVAMALTGERDAGLDAIEKAVKALKLTRRFFYDGALGDSPDYRDHRVGLLPDALQRWIDGDRPDLTPDEVECLRVLPPMEDWRYRAVLEHLRHARSA